ncbi:hypothetical protein IJ765_00720 [Candidatus Saccharibacteria bacterium]|nr:hypothetical protein [Candidatus Saccharibacteria bacterium]
MNIITPKTIPLGQVPRLNEYIIQNYIADNPSVLGLGDDLELKDREKVQASGGRLDLLFAKDDTRYEVEVQLGKTNPSHIIRTIEYWDLERKRNPQYEHYPVIVAEDITSRFMNILSLFNGSIPLIAIQMSAHCMSDNQLLLTFDQIIKLDLPDEDDDKEAQPTNREYWQTRTKMLESIDEIFSWLPNDRDDRVLKYNKFYIGISEGGIANNFISFHPKRNFMYLDIRMPEDEAFSDELEYAGLNIRYIDNKAYRIQIRDIDIDRVREKREILANAIRMAIKGD